WIHIEDLLDAVVFVLQTEALSGPVNFTAPEPVRNRDMARALAGAVNRPAFLPAPAFLIRTVLGEFGATLLASTRAIPQKLLDAGFTFQYPDIRKALEDLV
ncbi:MAG: DUF1731 domain-containing protein, partial [Desulfobacterales bacterium]